MQIHTNLKEPISQKPVVLTIGFFDGLHRGHQLLIDRTLEVAKEKDLASLVVTFENHPSTFFQKENPKKLLYTSAARLDLIKKFPIDHLLVLSFDAEIAGKSAEEFLKDIDRQAPIHHLILGYDAVLGHQRQGDRPYMERLAERWGFSLEYLGPIIFNGEPISSSAIRQALLQGNLPLAEELLGHPYP